MEGSYKPQLPGKSMDVKSRVKSIKNHNLGMLNWYLTTGGDLAETNLTTAIWCNSKQGNNSDLLLQFDDVTEKCHTGHKNAGTALEFSLAADLILLVVTADVDYRVAPHLQRPILERKHGR